MTPYVGVGEKDGCSGVMERWSGVGRSGETTPPCPYVGTCVVVVVEMALGWGVGFVEVGVGLRVGCPCVLR